MDNFNKIRNDLFCKYCGVQKNTLNSLKNHEIRCNKNPNKIKSGTPENLNLYHQKVKSGEMSVWNKGLTKETDKRVAAGSKKVSETLKTLFKEGQLPNLGRGSTKEKELLRRQKISESMKKNPKAGGLRKGAGNGKHGWYQGYYCDSTYELVFVIYNLDHNIKFSRNNKFYLYEYNGKIHKYYPDFEMENGDLVEIKGYTNELVHTKINAVKDKKIILLRHGDLKYMFDYIENNYSYEKITDLYDK